MFALLRCTAPMCALHSGMASRSTIPVAYPQGVTLLFVSGMFACRPPFPKGLFCKPDCFGFSFPTIADNGNLWPSILAGNLSQAVAIIVADDFRAVAGIVDAGAGT